MFLYMAFHEISGNVWKKSTETLEHVQKFMKDGLHIPDSKSLPLADYHRLPQQPIFKFGKKNNKAYHHQIDKRSADK